MPRLESRRRRRRMTPKEFADMCKENMRFRESFSMYGNSVTVYLQVFDGEKWEDIDGIYIIIPDGD